MYCQKYQEKQQKARNLNKLVESMNNKDNVLEDAAKIP
jgi:exonuclease VII small subunit